ncbi:MAG: class I tRNA ligase family protein [Minicystis sp.]
MPVLRLRLHDTLTAQSTPLVPKRPGEVRIDACGPISLDVAHLGHARAALAPDVLVRHLRAQGMTVTYVRSITDVGDEIRKRAGEQGLPPMELSAKMARRHQEDMGLIGCVEPDVQPKVAEHIPEVAALLEKLAARGARDVYYAVIEVVPPDEGPFARIWIHHGLVDGDEEKMATVRDVLAQNDREALRYFLLGAHYRGPIAFATEKLADGRAVFPGVVEAERQVDYLYRAIARLMAIGLPSPGGTAPAKMPKPLVPFTRLAADARARVDTALDDDLDTKGALAVLDEVAKGANELADLMQRRKQDTEVQRAAPFVAAQVLVALRLSAEPLGLLSATPEAYRERTQAQRLAILGMRPAQIDARLAERTAARAARDFARADAIRKEMDALGIEVTDAPEGTTWWITPIGSAPAAA